MLQEAYTDLCLLRDIIAGIRRRGHNHCLEEFNQLGEMIATLDKMKLILNPIQEKFPVDLTTGIREGLQIRP